MATTVQSLLDRFDALMNDVGSVRWPTAERLMWVNDGQRELVTFKDDAFVKHATITTTTGARQQVPSDCHKVLMVRVGTTGQAVLPCDRTALDAFSPAWMTALSTSAPKNWMPDESAEYIWVYPAQQTPGASLPVTYSAYPPVAAQGDSLSVRDGYASNVLNYMLYRAYSKDAETAGNAELAAAAYRLFRGE